MCHVPRRTRRPLCVSFRSLMRTIGQQTAEWKMHPSSSQPCSFVLSKRKSLKTNRWWTFVSTIKCNRIGQRHSVCSVGHATPSPCTHTETYTHRHTMIITFTHDPLPEVHTRAFGSMFDVGPGATTKHRMRNPFDINRKSIKRLRFVPKNRPKNGHPIYYVQG